MYENEVTYTIAEASERLGVSYRTLHYYESKFGLHINRDSSGNRIYKESDLNILDSIIEFKKKGMTLDSIKTMLQEKGILDASQKKELVILDENVLRAKEFIIHEICNAVAEQVRNELQETKEQIERLVLENRELHEQIRQLQRQSHDHYRELDKKLTAWRESSERSWQKQKEELEKKKKPWYRRIFK